MALRKSIREHVEKGRAPGLSGTPLEQAITESIVGMSQNALPALIRGMADTDEGYARKCYRLARRIHFVSFPEMRELLEQEFTMRFKEESLGQVIQRIEKISGFKFELRELDSRKLISMNLSDVAIYDWLDMLFKDFDFYWTIKKDVVVIGPSPATFLFVIEEDDKCSKDVRIAVTEAKRKWIDMSNFSQRDR
jgi:type II secretory pathway component GspD/PulD (secretin)